MENYNVLIIDDHPIICDSYKQAFLKIENAISSESKFKIEIANNCDSAIEKIERYSRSNPLDLVMLDIKLPPSRDGKIVSGEDLGVLIKNSYPKTKIIICTTYNDNYRIYNLIKNVDPDGLISKSEITNEELLNAIITVIKKPPYYSRTVNIMMRNQFSFEYSLDDIDRHLLFQISLGAKTMELPNELPLEIAAIEIRKRRLKEVFDADGKSDKILIQNAKRKGFL